MTTTKPRVNERAGEAPTLGELFIELVCADEQLLAVEFDAIIGASWGPVGWGDRGVVGAAMVPEGNAVPPLIVVGSRERGVLPRSKRPDGSREGRQRSPPRRDRNPAGA